MKLKYDWAYKQNAVGEISLVARISTPLLSWHYRCMWRFILSLFVSLIGRCTGSVQLVFTEILWSFEIIKGHFLQLKSSKCLSNKSDAIKRCTRKEPKTIWERLAVTKEMCNSNFAKIETNYYLQCMTTTCDVWIHNQSAWKNAIKLKFIVSCDVWAFASTPHWVVT